MHLGRRGCCRCLLPSINRKTSRFDKLCMLDSAQKSQNRASLPKSSGIGDMIQSHRHLPQRLYCHDLSNLSYGGAYSFARCWRCALLKLKYGSTHSTLPICDLTCLVHPSAHFGPRKNALFPGQKLPVASDYMVVTRLSLVCRVPSCAFPCGFKSFP